MNPRSSTDTHTIRTASAALAGALAAMTALATLASPTSAATLRGTVLDVETREPMQLVSVTVGGEAYHNGTITTPSGRYRFTDVPAGHYPVTVRYAGAPAGSGVAKYITVR